MTPPFKHIQKPPQKLVYLAHFVLTRAWGGLEMAAVEYARRLKASGYPGVLFTLEGSPASDKARELGLSVVTLKKCKYVSLSASLTIRRKLKEYGVQSILVHHLRDLWLLRPALIGMSKVEVFGFAHMFLHNVNKKDFIHAWLYGRLKNLIAMTPHQREALLKCLPIASERVVLIPNGTDSTKFSPSKRSDSVRAEVFGVQGDEKVIGVVGRLDPQKGQLEFLKAIQKLAPEHPNIRAVVVGRTTEGVKEYKDLLHAFVAANNLQDRVVFLEDLSDVSQAMACLDLFVLPSYRESFGTVLIEAMSSGVPVVATRAGGPPDILESETLGALAQPQNVESLAEVIGQCLSNWPRTLAKAEQALRVTRQKYDIESVLGQIESRLLSI